MNNIVVYTDGACSNNGKKAAKCSIGIHFSENNTIKFKDVSRSLNVPTPTNNIAELTAIKEAIQIIEANNIESYIHLYTDSEYSLNVLTKWYPQWLEKNKLSGKKNIKLIEETFKLYDRNPIFIHHIKAHTGYKDEHSIGNSIADKLATDALKFEIKNEGILKYFQ